MRKAICLLSFFLSLISNYPLTAANYNINDSIIIPLSISTKHLQSFSPKKPNLFMSNSLINVDKLAHQKSKDSSSHFHISPQRPGQYLIPLSLGTPPQTLHVLLDTASSLIWFPCGSNYSCQECNPPSGNSPSKIPTFDPSKSFTSNPLACTNPKCPFTKIRKDRINESKNCSHTCYDFSYVSGSTTGILLYETLHVSKQVVRKCIVGCSFSSTNIPNGVVGFGRTRWSLPTQMGLAKFSYCLSSRWFNDIQNSYLVLNGGSRSGLSYTPFQKNPYLHIFRNYYYVILETIIIGKKLINIPHKYLAPGSDGHGGTIVDSGSTITLMESSIFEGVLREFENQLGKATNIGNVGTVGPCFNISHKKSFDFPTLTFRYKGGAEMDLPYSNYLLGGGTRDILCLSIRNKNIFKTQGGPSIILGSTQQQDFHMEYDLRNERLGFRMEEC